MTGRSPRVCSFIQAQVVVCGLQIRDLHLLSEERSHGVSGGRLQQRQEERAWHSAPGGGWDLAVPSPLQCLLHSLPYGKGCTGSASPSDLDNAEHCGRRHGRAIDGLGAFSPGSSASLCLLPALANTATVEASSIPCSWNLSCATISTCTVSLTHSPVPSLSCQHPRGCFLLASPGRVLPTFRGPPAPGVLLISR